MKAETISVEMTMQEYYALMTAASIALDRTDAIPKDSRAPLEWVMTRLAGKWREVIEAWSETAERVDG
jgi:hypothetical protein